MQLNIFQVDAFTQTLMAGNSAAVIPLTQWLSDALMQKIANENNLSETAFYIPTANGQFHIRWFTPEVEVDLCGHATLAAAHIIMNELHPERDHIIFESQSGPLKVIRNGDRLTLDFPSRMPTTYNLEGLADALGIEPSWVFKARDVVVVLDNERSVHDLNPDLGKLKALNEFAFIVTAQSSQPDVDFVSRFFAPSVGVDEDPVTGSAHCSLTPYWAKVLNKNRMTAIQVSKRQGHLVCELNDDRVFLSGQSVTYLRGQIEVNLEA